MPSGGQLLRGGALLVAVLIPSVVLASLAVRHRVSEKSISASLERQTPSPEIECKRDVGDEYVCLAGDDAGHGHAYRLRMRGHCWTARRQDEAATTPPLPADASGCIALRDQHPIYEYFF